MLQHIVALRHLRAEDWVTLLAILAVAAVAIVLIWLAQRASAAEGEREGDGDRRPSPLDRLPPASPTPPRDYTAVNNAFDQWLGHNERMIEQRGIHHYNFAHKVLRGAFYENPAVFVQLILAPQAGRDVFEHLWSRAATEAMMAGFEPLGFDVRLPEPRDVTVAGRRGILFEMPPPEAPAEAYFTLALLPVDGATSGDDAAPLYYTLERVGLARGEQPTDPPATVLASWSSTAHSNYGAGPPPTAEAFLQAVASRLATAPARS